MTNLTRYNPVQELTNWRRQFERMFDQLDLVGGRQPVDGEEQPVMWAPRTDVSETDEGYVIRMDVPGLSRKDLSIELQDGTLVIRGERKSEREEKNENYFRVERSFGHFFRSFTLPQAGDTEKVNASMKDGVLTIQVAKREESKPRRIEIS